MDTLVRDGDDFQANCSFGDVRARTVLLATGVINNRPFMPDDLHDKAVARGLLRYCPICNGYEVTDQRVGVIGTGARGTHEALFIRSYTTDVTLVAPDGGHKLSREEASALTEAGVALGNGPARDFSIDGDRLRLKTEIGQLDFATVYPALGSAIRSELAIALGAHASDDGCLVVDDHQRTSVTRLYAAGDVVKGLDQISHAMGEGGVAATTTRNDMAEQAPLHR